MTNVAPSLLNLALPSLFLCSRPSPPATGPLYPQVRPPWRVPQSLNMMNSHPLSLSHRSALPGECRASECSLLCDDLHRLGFNRVAIDPTVHTTYHLHHAQVCVGGGGVREGRGREGRGGSRRGGEGAREGKRTGVGGACIGGRGRLFISLHPVVSRPSPPRLQQGADCAHHLLHAPRTCTCGGGGGLGREAGGRGREGGEGRKEGGGRGGREGRPAGHVVGGQRKVKRGRRWQAK